MGKTLNQRRHLAGYCTTGEAADALGVAPRTVSKLFDQGRLRGYRIPSCRNQDRRIEIASLKELARLSGAKLPPEFNDPVRAIGFAVPGGVAAALRRVAGEGATIELTDCPVEFGGLAATPARLVVVGFGYGSRIALAACEAAKRSNPEARTLAIVGDDMNAEDYIDGFSAVMLESHNGYDDAIESLLSSRGK